MRNACILGCLMLAPLSVAARQGAAVSEPALAARADILFFEDFDSKNWQGHWRGGNNAGYSRIEEALSFVIGQMTGQPNALLSKVFLGAGSLECEHHPGTHDPSEMTAVIPGQDCAYIRWYRKYEDGYDWVQHKMPGLYARRNPNEGGGAGEKPTGTDKFSAKLFVGWDRAPAIYSYHPEQQGGYGDHLRQNVGGTVFLETGRWYCFELMLKANTPQQRDGELKFWIDGAQKAYYKDMRFRDVPDLKINEVTHSAYVGGTWVSKRQQRLWDDNLVVAGQYVGPMKIEIKPPAKETVAKKVKKPPVKKEPPAEAFKALDDARKAALAEGFEAAAAILDKATASLDEEFRPMLAEPRGAYLSATGMKWWVIDGVKEGRKEKVLVEITGNPVRADLVGASADGIDVLYADGTVHLKWQEFSAVRLVDIFSRFKPPGSEAEAQLQALKKALGLKE